MGADGGADEQRTSEPRTSTAAEATTRLPALNIDRCIPPAKPTPGQARNGKILTLPGGSIKPIDTVRCAGWRQMAT